MSAFPKGWFYIQCPTRQDQVLTVPNMATQTSTRVELRPKQRKIGEINENNNHQLWCYHTDGYLVNKYSGCVLGVEKDKFKDQNIYQSKRSPLDSNDHKRQIWKYDLEDKRLVLIDEKNRKFALNNLAVPRLEAEEEKGCSWLLTQHEEE